MATLTVPSPQLVSNSPAVNLRSRYRPLSTHGLPREPRTMSPLEHHRIPAPGLPSPSFTSTTMSPLLPSALSPPMSAKSFGTFIDSEPSTPAYSPRMDHDWDSSPLVLLRPMSSSSEPSSPMEPEWDMMVPLKVPQSTGRTFLAQTPAVTSKDISLALSLSSHSVSSTKPMRPVNALKEIKVVGLSHKETQTSLGEEHEEKEQDKQQDEQVAGNNNASFGKLASRMKLMLRRKSTNDKKKHKREPSFYDVDRLENVHWTEM